jgi:hypothetical protein
MRSILLYNLYPRTIWRSLTASILGDVPHHDTIAVHVSLPLHLVPLYPVISRHLRAFPKVSLICASLNRRHKGESVGFNRLRTTLDFNPFDIVTYVHSKGSSRKRKNTAPIAAWTDYMRYFVVQRHDLCHQAFEQGYYTYGVELTPHVFARKEHERLFAACRFMYKGGFVSLNLRHLRSAFLSSPCIEHYYAVERFWGTLCDIEHAYCAFQSAIDLYQTPLSPSRYTGTA